ncbi:hypothetical protein L226DRAFT_523183 [Lentinus tigrinus ALCF2SS1-7]|uniref:Uncharacterized protein n=1 Tax=Lentinus tigrinus ALCF2SS1-6 TaxID=1328759 RepID=A0A5C2S8H8_9APHY|nr:hypothetical protein L227DRAFT_575714 [Lentinus tigrinus ALCF2SS1-6]RPD74900.1 hypothetical protein L226DRAFT_523183 [Lentinus tigrinus ALCF2SS1-7]
MGFSSNYLRISVALLFVSVTLFTVGRNSKGERADAEQAHQFTYRGRDYPRAWPLPPLDPVHLSHEDSVHYSLETDIGVAEWNATLPSGGTVIHLGPDGRPFTVSMFHQLRCLDIIRDVIVDFYLDTSPDARPGKREIVQHCMNYLRQTVMCRGDLHIETVRAPSGPTVTVSAVTHSCKDWTVVYKAAEENYREFLEEAARRR